MPYIKPDHSRVWFFLRGPSVGAAVSTFSSFEFPLNRGADEISAFFAFPQYFVDPFQRSSRNTSGSLFVIDTLAAHGKNSRYHLLTECDK